MRAFGMRLLKLRLIFKNGFCHQIDMIFRKVGVADEQAGNGQCFGICIGLVSVFRNISFEKNLFSLMILSRVALSMERAFIFLQWKAR